VPVTLPTVGSFNWGDVVNTAINALSTAYDTQKLSRMASGSVAVTLTAAASGTAPVLFPPGRFASPPVVVATLSSGSAAYIAGIGSITVNGFTAIAFHRAATATSGVLTVQWIAVATL